MVATRRNGTANKGNAAEKMAGKRTRDPEEKREDGEQKEQKGGKGGNEGKGGKRAKGEKAVRKAENSCEEMPWWSENEVKVKEENDKDEDTVEKNKWDGVAVKIEGEQKGSDLTAVYSKKTKPRGGGGASAGPQIESEDEKKGKNAKNKKVKTEAKKEDSEEASVVKPEMGGASSESQKKGKSVKTKKVKTEAKKEISEEALVVMPGMGGASPVYPGWPHPTVVECEELHRELVELHGAKEQQKRPPQPILDSLVGTILSQNTTNKNSSAAFASLKEKFPTWEEVRTGDVLELEESIRTGGLAKIKAGRIQHICQQLFEERGEVSLEHLRDAPSHEIHSYLSRFPGCGPKTISCVLLFNLQRPDFAVDTHVFRLASQAGWVPDEKSVKRHNKTRELPGSSLPPWKPASRETTYAHLNAVVPDALKYSLHVLLIAHGRTISPAQGPKDVDACPIARKAAKLKKEKTPPAS